MFDSEKSEHRIIMYFFHCQPVQNPRMGIKAMVYIVTHVKIKNFFHVEIFTNTLHILCASPSRNNNAMRILFQFSIGYKNRIFLSESYNPPSSLMVGEKFSVKWWQSHEVELNFHAYFVHRNSIFLNFTFTRELFVSNKKYERNQYSFRLFKSKLEHLKKHLWKRWFNKNIKLAVNTLQKLQNFLVSFLVRKYEHNQTKTMKWM